MNLESLIASAAENGASDLHLEAGLPPALRIRGALKIAGEPVQPRALLELARTVIGSEQWPSFVERKSFDLSRTIAGVRCRINILQTSRGVGFAIRLLAAFEATVESLNLHPDLRKFVGHQHGLILVSGPTGSGKSSTLAALIQEINLSDARHIVTIENPVEYSFRPRRAYIRQREVGRDTPSFEQALLDALREDPDVIMVGEMRDPETMRLTLNAAETGHLVFATVHSSNCAEALQRVVSAFPSEIQNSIASELADCLIGVIAQRLQFRSNINIRVPECEVLTATIPVKTYIRSRDFYKVPTALETGAEHGMWTFARYRTWLDKRTQFHIPQSPNAPAEEEPTRAAPELTPTQRSTVSTVTPSTKSKPTTSPETGRIEIEPVEEFDKILKKPQ